MRILRNALWCAGALLLAGGALLTLGACGGSAERTAADTQGAGASPAASRTSGATTGSGTAETGVGVAGDVRRAVEKYLAARDRVLIPGADGDELARLLRPGSPAEQQEPLAARGRTTLAARAGVSYATARTVTTVAAGAVSLYNGSAPLPAGTAEGQAPTAEWRAVVVASSVGGFTFSDLTEQAVREDHIIVLSPAADGWQVFSDQYAEPALADWLRAGGASPAQVRAARVWAAQTARARRQAVTPDSAMSAFVAALDARRYAVADLFLDPVFGGTAQGMGMWLESIRLEKTQPIGAATQTDALLQVTLQVQARASSWNNGANVRFVTLSRRAANEPWRISAIDSGP